MNYEFFNWDSIVEALGMILLVIVLFVVIPAVLKFIFIGIPGMLLNGRKKAKEKGQDAGTANAAEWKKTELEEKAAAQTPEGAKGMEVQPGSMQEKPDAQPKPGGARESLDALYARSHGLWVCRYCETLNDRERPRCIACGAEKKP